MSLHEQDIALADVADAAADPADQRKPLLRTSTIFWMNFGFFGVNFSMGLQQTAINPLFTLIGARPDELPILNLAGPVTGLLIQPMIGVISDRTWHPRFGRRKPFFLFGIIGAAIVLFLFPFVSAVWMAVLLLWLMDASNNTAMEPYRALISDKLRLSQRTKGYLVQGMLIGAGTVAANVSLFVFQSLISGATSAGVPYWVPATFWIGSIFALGSVLISVLNTKEIPPTERELAELRAKPKGLGAIVREIADAVR